MANPGGVDKHPDLDQTYKKNSDPDPTLEKYPDPDPQPCWKV